MKRAPSRFIALVPKETVNTNKTLGYYQKQMAEYFRQSFSTWLRAHWAIHRSVTLVLLSDIGAVAGNLLVVVLVVRVLSVSVTQDPNANRHAQTSQTPMDFFISTVYRKQIHRASKQAIATTTTFSMRSFIGWK
jgi:hypothetical protein